MKTKWLVLSLAWLTLFVSAASAGKQSDLTALELLQKSEARMRSAGTVAVYRVETVRPDWQRTLKFRSHDDYPNNRFRLEILSPRKLKGTVFLKTDNRLYMYLPKLRRKIAISPAMMHDPWMGTDFTNQDLIESGSLVEDYLHRLVSADGETAPDVAAVESVPKPDAPVVWGKVHFKLAADGAPREIRFFDTEEHLVRGMRFSESKDFGGRMIPTRIRMQPADKPDQHTEIIIEDVEFDAAMPDNLFMLPAKKAKQGS